MIKSINVLSDFDKDTRIYVIGMGYIWDGTDDYRKYLDPLKLSRLLMFWHKYFEASSAIVGEIGAPSMLGSIK